MAKKTQVIITDDIDGSVDARTMTFGLDGNLYSIDLADHHIRELYSVLEKFREHGTRLGKFHQSKTAKAGFPTAPARQPVGVNRERNAAIRAWAAQQGIQVSARGRIQDAVVAKYDAANPT
jgi:hypothetical protein